MLVYFSLASEEEITGRSEFESAVTGDPGGTESEYCDVSCDASSDSTQLYDSDGTQVYDSDRQLLNMKEKNKDKNESRDLLRLPSVASCPHPTPNESMRVY